MRTVGDVMRSPVVVATPTSTATDLVSLRRQHGIQHFPVVEDGRIVGIVTDRNLREAVTDPRVFTLLLDLIASMDRVVVRDIMVRDVVTASRDVPLPEAARLMVERKIGCLPIVEEGRVVGIVTATDILAVVAAGGSA